VDSDRNVAANVSIENLSTFILASGLFTWEKWKDFFFPEKKEFSFPKEAVVVFIPCRKCNEEVLIPNLRRISSVLRGELESIGFRVIFSSVFVEKGGYIVVVPDAVKLGQASLHIGPPVTSQNIRSFLKKWKDGTPFGMPFMVGDRVCVLREREVDDISHAIAGILPKIKLSSDFDQNRMIVISGKDLGKVPASVRNGFLFPSLGKWVGNLGDV